MVISRPIVHLSPPLDPAGLGARLSFCSFDTARMQWSTVLLIAAGRVLIGNVVDLWCHAYAVGEQTDRELFLLGWSPFTGEAQWGMFPLLHSSQMAPMDLLDPKLRNIW